MKLPSEKKKPSASENVAAMRRTNMYFSAPQMERLSSLSETSGLSVAEHVRRAVDAYLKKIR